MNELFRTIDASLPEKIREAASKGTTPDVLFAAVTAKDSSDRDNTPMHVMARNSKLPEALAALRDSGVTGVMLLKSIIMPNSLDLTALEYAELSDTTARVLAELRQGNVAEIELEPTFRAFLIPYAKHTTDAEAAGLTSGGSAAVRLATGVLRATGFAVGGGSQRRTGPDGNEH
jgi:hypothetical protein